MKKINNSILQNNFELEKIKKEFFEKKKEIETNFYKENNGTETCKRFSEITDELIRSFHKKILFNDQSEVDNYIVCAVGGYGRNQLAPYSDLDILFVIFCPEKIVRSHIEKILFFLWDMGFKVGHAVRNLKEIKITASADHVIQTSILENRIIVGKEHLYKKVLFEVDNFFNTTDPREFILSKINERERRVKNCQNNSFLLEPNIKESVGGLRDINTLFWYLIRLSKTGNQIVNNKLEYLSKLEKNKIKKALDFFLTIRCYLHFQNNRANERLSFGSQKFISKKMKYKSRDSTLRVERFMKHYYIQIRNVRNILNCVVSIKNLSKGNIAENLEFLSKGTVLCDDMILINNKSKFLSHSENFINIFYDSSNLEKFIHPRSLRIICDNISNLSSNFHLKKSVTKRFLEILNSDLISDNLNIMNDCGLLAKIIPDFSRIISQSQFDLYHVYTVDQHTLRALKFLKNLSSESLNDKKFSHTKLIYKNSKNKLILYLAVLLHDIGKGLGGNHQVKGANLTRKILKDLNFNLKDSEEVIWLVRNHLIFSDFALNNDIHDISVVKVFLKKVKSSQRLKFLYLLTVVDMASVNESSWNDWKALLLKNLYEKIDFEIKKPILLKLKIFEKKVEKKIGLIKTKVFFQLNKNSESQFNAFSKICSNDFWLSQSIEEIVKQIDGFFLGSRILKPYDFSVEFTDMSGFFSITIVTKDRKNLLLRIIQKFILNGMDILEARAFTMSNNIIVDTFILSVNSNLKYNYSDLKDKKQKLSDDLKNLLKGKLVLNLGYDSNKEFKKVLKQESRISLDNQLSKNYTVVKVFTNDRPYLLYDILKLLIKNDLIISAAKISTFGNFVEDTFHVRKKNGLKVEDSENLRNGLKSLVTILN